MASMIENFTGHSLLLQTNKLIGNVNACMGFIKNEQNVYVPNTALKKDIRDIADDRKKIIDILKNQDINEKIDINKIYSDDKFIDKEICQFMINKENKQ